MMSNSQTKVAQAKQEAEAGRRRQYQRHYNTSGDDRRERQNSRHATPSSAGPQPPINLGSSILDSFRLMNMAASQPPVESPQRRNKRRGDDVRRSANAKKVKKVLRPRPSLVVKLKLRREKSFSVLSGSTSPEQLLSPKPTSSTLDSSGSGDCALSSAFQNQPHAGGKKHSTQDPNKSSTWESGHAAKIAASCLRQTSHGHTRADASTTPARMDIPPGRGPSGNDEAATASHANCQNFHQPSTSSRNSSLLHERLFATFARAVPFGGQAVSFLCSFCSKLKWENISQPVE